MWWGKHSLLMGMLASRVSGRQPLVVRAPALLFLLLMGRRPLLFPVVLELPQPLLMLVVVPLLQEVKQAQMQLATKKKQNMMGVRQTRPVPGSELWPVAKMTRRSLCVVA